jgi:hypothetical protein
MQSKREFDAAIRVLEALRKPQGATIILTWDEEMQRAYIGLSRAGYVATTGGTGRRGGSFKWDTIETTALGDTYLSQIKAAERAKR